MCEAMANSSEEQSDQSVVEGEEELAEETALAFSDKRHTESIEGVNAITQTWRMKERVSISYSISYCIHSLNCTECMHITKS